MNMRVEMLDGGLKRMALIGRMDIVGTQQIDLKLSSEAAAEKVFVIVDLSQVDFMATIGIGALVRTAKSLKLRNGKLVLLNPQPVVSMVLTATKINTIIPICQTLKDAKSVLFGVT